MAVIHCGFCKHPGVHAQIQPSGGAFSSICADCPTCQAEAQQKPTR